MSKLNRTLKIGSLNLSNRLVLPPMATAKSTADGYVSQGIIDYYNEKTLGGYISLVIIEHSFISQEGKASENQLSIADDSVVEELKKLAETIQANGSKAVMQINHAGSAANEEITGETPVGPSAIPNPRMGGIPHELSKKEIGDMVKKFRDAAIRTKNAGFDGVEIHSAHGYFLNQFFSPLTNKRTDEYGGNVKNRIRIHLEVIKEIRKAVGEDFPLLLRLGASDYTEGGATIEDSIIASKAFEEAGISIIDISGGFCGYSVEGLTGEGYFSPLTEAIKNEISIPVLLTGGIISGEGAEKLLSENKADLIGVGRAIFKDSNWPKMTMEGVIENILK